MRNLTPSLALLTTHNRAMAASTAAKPKVIKVIS